MSIVWTEPAAKDSPAATYEVAITVETAVQNLSSHPKMGRIGRVANSYELVIPSLPYIAAY